MSQLVGSFFLAPDQRFLAVESRATSLLPPEEGDLLGKNVRQVAGGALWKIVRPVLERALIERGRVMQTVDSYGVEVEPRVDGFQVRLFERPAPPKYGTVAPATTEDDFFDLAADPLCVLSATDSRLLRTNPAWAALGYSPDDLAGRTLLELAHPDDRADLYAELQQVVRAGQDSPRRFTFTCRCRNATGDYRYLQWSASARPKVDQVFAAARDITETRAEVAAIRRQVNTDTLTGLSNRGHLDEQLTRVLIEAERHRHSVAVLFIDLDRFKPINDNLGHDVGDQMLQVVARRLTGCLRGEDFVARHGGDEFVVVLPRIGAPSDAVAVVQKLLASIQAPCTLAGRDLWVTASIGVSLFPYHGRDAETLIKNADTAMYRAKKEKRGGWALYSDDINQNSLERMVLESGLIQATERGEISLYYQPQCSRLSGRIVGFEALMRWNHASLGPIAPERFIPLAEETGQIIPLGHWALAEAARQAAEWQNVIQGLSMSVNVSARQLHEVDLAEQIREILDQVNLPPERLDLELTETAFIQDEERVRATLYKLKDLGVRLSVDDFGTGYSNLVYLRRMPIDRVKIDRSFIANLCQNPNDEAVVRAVIELVHVLGLKVVAEGVETQEQYDKLVELRCDILQGYFVGKPLPAGEVPRLLPPKL